MDVACVTTPFGRRPMTLAMLMRQRQAEAVETNIKRNKWKLFRAICEARSLLDVSDRSLSVLDALLSFYPADELETSRGLVVFPSNAQLSVRARGMTAATLRRHLAALVDAGLILRKDSPNGKRYARRGRAGEVSEAFGFSLAPLLSRAVEIETLAAELTAERELLRATRERLTLCRRDISKLIQVALNDGADGDWEGLLARFEALILRIPRQPTLVGLQSLLEAFAALRETILNILETQHNSQKIDAKESQNERHIQDSHPESFYEFDQDKQTQPVNDLQEVDAPAQTSSCTSESNSLKNTKPPVAVSLDLVMRACPEICAYGSGGTIRTWHELVTAALLVSSMLQISPSAFEMACRTMGPENAAIVVACIFERGGDINCAGGYLRDLARRASINAFTVRPMLMALMRTNRATTSLPA